MVIIVSVWTEVHAAWQPLVTFFSSINHDSQGFSLGGSYSYIWKENQNFQRMEHFREPIYSGCKCVGVKRVQINLDLQALTSYNDLNHHCRYQDSFFKAHGTKRMPGTTCKKVQVQPLKVGFISWIRFGDLREGCRKQKSDIMYGSDSVWKIKVRALTTSCIEPMLTCKVVGYSTWVLTAQWTLVTNMHVVYTSPF